MSNKPLEEVIQEINTIIETNHSPEEQKTAKELIATMIDTLTLDMEQLNEFKQNLQQNNFTNDVLKSYFINLIDDRIEFLQLEGMSPAQRKAHEFMKIVNTTDEQEREMLESELDVRGLNSQLKINNGPFGLLYYGKDEKGNIGIGLRISRRASSDQVVYIPEEKLESFFEKSNMEILSIFHEEINNRSSYMFSESELKTLYLIDCLRDEGIQFESEFYDLTNSDIKLGLKDNQYLESSSDIFEMGKHGEDPDCIMFTYGDEPGTVHEEVISEGSESQLHSIYIAASKKFPEIVKKVRAGEFHLKLNTREEELSSLEAEEQTISEAEALIDKQAEKEGQDIGEE